MKIDEEFSLLQLISFLFPRNYASTIQYKDQAESEAYLQTAS